MLAATNQMPFSVHVLVLRSGGNEDQAVQAVLHNHHADQPDGCRGSRLHGWRLLHLGRYASRVVFVYLFVGSLFDVIPEEVFCRARICHTLRYFRHRRDRSVLQSNCVFSA